MINLFHRLQNIFSSYLLYIVSFKVPLRDLVSLNYTYILRYLELTWANRKSHNTRRISISTSVNTRTAWNDLKIRIFDILTGHVGANMHRLQGDYASSLPTNPSNYEHCHFRFPAFNIRFLHGKQQKIIP